MPRFRNLNHVGSFILDKLNPPVEEEPPRPPEPRGWNSADMPPGSYGGYAGPVWIWDEPGGVRVGIYERGNWYQDDERLDAFTGYWKYFKRDEI